MLPSLIINAAQNRAWSKGARAEHGPFEALAERIHEIDMLNNPSLFTGAAMSAAGIPPNSSGNATTQSGDPYYGPTVNNAPNYVPSNYVATELQGIPPELLYQPQVTPYSGGQGWAPQYAGFGQTSRPQIPYQIPESAYDYTTRYYDPTQSWKSYRNVNPFVEELLTRGQPRYGNQPHHKVWDALHREGYGGIRGLDFRANPNYGLDIKRVESGIQDHWRESLQVSGSGREDILDWDGGYAQAQQREFNRQVLTGDVDWNYYNTDPRYKRLGQLAKERASKPGLFGADWTGYDDVQQIRYINEFIRSGAEPQQGAISPEMFRANLAARGQQEQWDRWMAAQPSWLNTGQAIQALGGVTQTDVQSLSDQFRDSLRGYEELWDTTFADAQADWRSAQERALEEQRSGYMSELQRQGDVYGSRISALSDEITGYQGDISGLRGQIGDYQDEIGGLQGSLMASNAAREALDARVREYQEMQIRNQERARVAASYGATGQPLNPSVTGVKTDWGKELGGDKIRGSRSYFRRTGDRISGIKTDALNV